MFVYLAYRGIMSCIRTRHDEVFLVALAGYLLIGLGSIYFQSTLKCIYFWISFFCPDMCVKSTKCPVDIRY